MDSLDAPSLHLQLRRQLVLGGWLKTCVLWRVLLAGLETAVTANLWISKEDAAWKREVEYWVLLPFKLLVLAYLFSIVTNVYMRITNSDIDLVNHTVINMTKFRIACDQDQTCMDQLIRASENQDYWRHFISSEKSRNVSRRGNRENKSMLFPLLDHRTTPDRWIDALVDKYYGDRLDVADGLEKLDLAISTIKSEMFANPFDED